MKARVRPKRDRERTSTEIQRKDEHSVTKIALNVQKRRETSYLEPESVQDNHKSLIQSMSESVSQSMSE